MKKLSLSSPLTDLPGIAKVRAEAFRRLGICTVRDLLFHFPRSYENRGDIKTLAEAIDGGPHALALVVATPPKTANIRRGMSITKFRAFDATGTAEIMFFNQPYCRDIFAVGEEFRFFGKLSLEGRVLRMTNPSYEKIAPDIPLADLVPRYPLGEGLSPKIISNAISAALSCLDDVEDFLPEDIRRKRSFPTLATAIKTLHEPPTAPLLRSALDRLAFNEYFVFSLSLAMAHRKHASSGGAACTKQNISPLLALLPYELTESQKTVVREIAEDMACTDGIPMSRILVGDVGCGKTICAAIAAYIAILNGHQATIMAPTEILARQHYHDLSQFFSQLGIKTELLIGATPAREKNRICKELAEMGKNRIDLLIGTHALLNEKLVFSDLALAVTDEQHRFGVGQRAKIREKNPSCHLLVMSATPIPRTLALVLYGDLNISRITEMPIGRKRVDTHLIGEALRERLNGFIRSTVSDGGQVYIVCPAIEEDEGAIPLGRVYLEADEHVSPLKTAVEHAEALASLFPEYRIAVMHGKLKPIAKDDIMQRFSDGKIDILVSTTVIEVGVNVPNASLMIVENADRFGLSQLHQLRGRVGRGTRKSYCILVSDTKGETANRRLQALCHTYDGYAIAEEDLRLRGPGDFFGSYAEDTVRQSGGLHFSAIAASADPTIPKAAFEEAKRILECDPELIRPEHRALATEISRMFCVENTSFS